MLAAEWKQKCLNVLNMNNTASCTKHSETISLAGLSLTTTITVLRTRGQQQSDRLHTPGTAWHHDTVQPGTYTVARRSPPNIRPSYKERCRLKPLYPLQRRPEHSSVLALSNLLTQSLGSPATSSQSRHQTPMRRLSTPSKAPQPCAPLTGPWPESARPPPPPAAI